MAAAQIHLILNHIPVLGGVAVLALYAIAAFKDNQSFARLTLQLMVLVGVLSLPVYFTGELAQKVVGLLPGVSGPVIDKHERFALISLISTEFLALIGCILLVRLRKDRSQIMNHWNAIGVVSLINASLMIATANLGTEIHHPEIRKNAAVSFKTLQIKSNMPEEKVV